MRSSPGVSALALLMWSIPATAASPSGFSRTCKETGQGNRDCTIKAGNDLEFELVIEPNGRHTLMVIKQVEFAKTKYYLKGGNSGHDCYVVMVRGDGLIDDAVFVSPKDASFVEDWGDAKCDLTVPLGATEASPRLTQARVAAFQEQQANLKKLQGVVDKLDAKAEQDKADCMRIGDESYCRCALERMPLGGTFNKYLDFVLNVAIDTRTVPDDQFRDFPASARRIMDGYSRMRAECGASGTQPARKPVRAK